jgi:hypothetical protein
MSGKNMAYRKEFITAVSEGKHAPENSGERRTNESRDNATADHKSVRL